MSIFSSVEELLSECGKRKAPLWRLVMEYSAHESGIEPQKSWDEMSRRLCAMRDAAASYEPEQRSRSGLSGGDGAGLLILLCTLCAVAVGYLCDRYLNRNFLSALMMSLLTLIVMQGLLFLFKRYLGQTGEEGWSILLKQIGLSMLACPPVYLAAWAIGKVGK